MGESLASLVTRHYRRLKRCLRRMKSKRKPMRRKVSHCLARKHVTRVTTSFLIGLSPREGSVLRIDRTAAALSARRLGAFCHVGRLVVHRRRLLLVHHVHDHRLRRFRARREHDQLPQRQIADLRDVLAVRSAAHSNELPIDSRRYRSDQEQSLAASRHRQDNCKTRFTNLPLLIRLRTDISSSTTHSLLCPILSQINVVTQRLTYWGGKKDEKE